MATLLVVEQPRLAWPVLFVSELIYSEWIRSICGINFINATNPVRKSHSPTLE